MEITLELNLLNKSKYSDEYVTNLIYWAVLNLEEPVFKEIIDIQANKVIVYNTKEFVGLNFCNLE